MEFEVPSVLQSTCCSTPLAHVQHATTLQHTATAAH